VTFRTLFARLANATALGAGHPVSFALAVLVVIAWAATGPLFHYSDGWQLVINTGTTVITFLMVFLIQATESRDTAAIQAKLDELIRVNDRARNELIAVEQADEPPLRVLNQPSSIQPPLR
jgi:low affinity Fe/Cu permease